MRAGIVVDDYKLPVFRKRLTEAGFTYTDAGGLTPNTTVLTVETDNIVKLQAVVKAAEKESKR